jgi:orotate phosphoribosyltransferase
LQTKEEIALILLEAEAVSLKPKEPFRFVSGILSPIYCDNRLLISDPEKREKILTAYLAGLEKLGAEFDIVAGTATAGIPWSAWIADRLGKPMIYVRSGAKDHGKQNQIEGRVAPGAKVVVIEDLVSTGGSSVRAVQAVKQAGMAVMGCVAIFTYGMAKAARAFEEAGCPVVTLSDFPALVTAAIDNRYISPEEKEAVLEWSGDPAGWGKKRGLE